jgi:integrase
VRQPLHAWSQSTGLRLCGKTDETSVEDNAVLERHDHEAAEAVRSRSALAPRTIRQIVGVVSTMFKRATKEEIVVSNPVIMERGTLPKKVDKDPTWRHEAIYTREEAELLVSDPRILVDRRVLYALKFLGGGMRHGEAASLTWRQYEQAAEPLGRINLGKTKSGAPREIPVHPTLAKILALWKLSGWEETYGRKPTADDLIVPTRNMTARKPAEAQEALIADLQLLELRVRAGKDRNRRGHDLRRTNSIPVHPGCSLPVSAFWATVASRKSPGGSPLALGANQLPGAAARSISDRHRSCAGNTLLEWDDEDVIALYADWLPRSIYGTPFETGPPAARAPYRLMEGRGESEPALDRGREPDPAGLAAVDDVTPLRTTVRRRRSACRRRRRRFRALSIGDPLDLALLHLAHDARTSSSTRSGSSRERLELTDPCIERDALWCGR